MRVRKEELLTVAFVVLLGIVLGAGSAGYTRSGMQSEIDAIASQLELAEQSVAESSTERDMYADQVLGLKSRLDALETSASVEASRSAAVIDALTDKLTDLGYSVSIDATGGVSVEAPKPKTTTPSVSRGISRNIGGVEQWRSLVAKYFKSNNVDAALSVMTGESHGNPSETNGQHIGLFQIASIVHRVKLAEKAASWGMVNDLKDPEFNVRFAAYMSAGGDNWSRWEVQP